MDGRMDVYSCLVEAKILTTYLGKECSIDIRLAARVVSLLSLLRRVFVCGLWWAEEIVSLKFVISTILH